MIPEIVVRKIWWYEWKMKQREICEEYRVKYYYRYETGETITISVGKYINIYNWRKLESVIMNKNYLFNIYNYKDKVVGDLSKNYTYSNGSKCKIID